MHVLLRKRAVSHRALPSCCAAFNARECTSFFELDHAHSLLYIIGYVQPAVLMLARIPRGNTHTHTLIHTARLINPASSVDRPAGLIHASHCALVITASTCSFPGLIRERNALHAVRVAYEISAQAHSNLIRQCIHQCTVLPTSPGRPGRVRALLYCKRGRIIADSALDTTRPVHGYQFDHDAHRCACHTTVPLD
jgi:hypothetical protein